MWRNTNKYSELCLIKINDAQVVANNNNNKKINTKLTFEEPSFECVSSAGRHRFTVYGAFEVLAIRPRRIDVFLVYDMSTGQFHHRLVPREVFRVHSAPSLRHQSRRLILSRSKRVSERQRASSSHTSDTSEAMIMIIVAVAVHADVRLALVDRDDGRGRRVPGVFRSRSAARSARATRVGAFAERSDEGVEAFGE